jgi:hypothetical protein
MASLSPADSSLNVCALPRHVHQGFIASGGISCWWSLAMLALVEDVSSLPMMAAAVQLLSIVIPG